MRARRGVRLGGRGPPAHAVRSSIRRWTGGAKGVSTTTSSAHMSREMGRARGQGVALAAGDEVFRGRLRASG